MIIKAQAGELFELYILGPMARKNSGSLPCDHGSGAASNQINRN
jgi:hypothetical protein